MQRLDLDFHAARPSRAAGWLLLAAAIAFTADLGISYVSTYRSAARSEAELAAIEQPARAARAARAEKVKPEEMAAAREAIEQLALPWNALFQALETTASRDVALLSIEPDPQSGKVTISGETRDLKGALDYVAKLEGSPMLNDAHLVKHEVRAHEAQKMVVFVAAATWKAAQR